VEWIDATIRKVAQIFCLIQQAHFALLFVGWKKQESNQREFIVYYFITKLIQSIEKLPENINGEYSLNLHTSLKECFSTKLLTIGTNKQSIDVS
jgi:hypothetical protein